jgi:hypothetical protein
MCRISKKFPQFFKLVEHWVMQLDEILSDTYVATLISWFDKRNFLMRKRLRCFNQGVGYIELLELLVLNTHVAAKIYNDTTKVEKKIEETSNILHTLYTYRVHCMYIYIYTYIYIYLQESYIYIYTHTHEYVYDLNYFCIRCVC